ncbi:MAG: hypothetical protein JW984_16195 [Deltaproteobacteria bacterium]|uniref:Uncharacterized protein n=1 Tax=Candidatus Zymogenus saltonus TaxID=2844893 RepID=A0A9D8KJN8_9DELT|nr:hypothetical protein [Candidatus Zymogenus saltonus]
MKQTIKIDKRINEKKILRELEEKQREIPKIVIMSDKTERTLNPSTILFVNYLNKNIKDIKLKKEIFDILYELIEIRDYYFKVSIDIHKRDDMFSKAKDAVKKINYRIESLNASIKPELHTYFSKIGDFTLNPGVTLRFGNREPRTKEHKAFLLLSDFLKSRDFHLLGRCAFRVRGRKSCNNLFLSTNKTTEHCSRWCGQTHSRLKKDF